MMLEADGNERVNSHTPTSSFTRGFTLNAARASIIGRFRGGSADSAGIPAVNMGHHSASPSIDFSRQRVSEGSDSASTVSYWWCFGPGAIAVTVVLTLCTLVVEAVAVAISVTSSFRRRTA